MDAVIPTPAIRPDTLPRATTWLTMGMMALVIAAGLFFQISALEWCVCFVLFGLIMSLELVNTAVESVVDLVTEKRHPLAKLAKDAAAGAVLIASIMAAAAGLIIFIPKGWRFLLGLLG